jgi:tetratricopeptide (TPR) repeat protein
MVEQAEIVTTASRAERSENIAALQRRAPSAVAAAAPKMADSDSEDHSIVVTGSRIDRRKPAGRGDWNACTVNDPSRSLRGCGSLVNPGAKGEAGRAAAHVSDGLSRAWRGDMDGAIAAFDQAIAASPRNAFAYLNRGLARQRNGDTDSAIADLDQAVRYAPRAARVYYNRSLLLRERGDTRRARVDEDRALGIDPTYDAVVQ